VARPRSRPERPAPRATPARVPETASEREGRGIFGTDGIRGEVGLPPMTPEWVLKLGWAAGRVLGRDHAHRGVVIGKDTRNSGYLFESALESGLSAAGASVFLLGPFPTPGVSYITTAIGAAAGIVISASHNPYQDNGIKFFGPDGRKLPDALEREIEDRLREPLQLVSLHALGQVRRLDDASERYIEFCLASVPSDMHLRGWTICVDCAHGATYRLAPALFERLGARVIPIGVDPNGLNINDQVGSLHPEALVQAVRSHQADLGVAFDGDGDRVILVDADGQIIDGDALLYILACDRLEENRLQGPVVGTVMANLGLEETLNERQIAFCRAPVGDRQVLARLEAEGGVLGGESSGHLIHLDLSPTGDGMISALQVIRASWRQARPLSSLVAGLHRYPQKTVNVSWPRGCGLPDPLEMEEDLQSARRLLGSPARILIRPSGTEPLLRVTVEGGHSASLEQATARLVERLTQLRDAAR